MRTLKPFTYLGDYIDGMFVVPKEKNGEFKSINPGDTKDVLGEFSYSFSHVSKAIQCAEKAFPKWKALSLEERATYLKKFYREIEIHLAEIAELISRETGKPFWEATQEAQGLLGKINITLQEGVKLILEHEVANAQPNIIGRYRFKPKGVMAVIGPFNFPAHLPHGHYVPALLTGNTIIFKPSEQTPAVGQKIAELIHRAQFPPGVFNLIQGEKEVGKRLCLDQKVDGILFTGSYEVGLKIKQDTSAHFWKTLVLEMGGKNASLILEDAYLPKALYENIKGAYLTAGQRCSATSRIILTEKIAKSFLKEFTRMSGELKIGYAFDEPEPFMGPLISKDAQNKYMRFQGIAEREGFEPIMRGKELSLAHSGYYVTPSIYLAKAKKESSMYLETEIFGPSVAIHIVKDIEEAIEEANRTTFGLVVSVFTKDKKAYEKVFEKTKTGLVNWNRSTVGASSKLPFGGQGKSGNQFPTALFAPYYCTYPVSCLEDPSDILQETHLPGLPPLCAS
ncbi:MAG: N-succinylglutamate 5-semialdehyde dehydrogenase [Deltaproteobacteria bacterium GWA2_38_16]|nr:MAG: N-succinylglutamate 5-semialdehyde dehydrogenase [Deltaproteobacteria bacterium GWA2_38_16]OGQ03391.1 MAG: N-succinylglutamate 5-semialdehyde dehydrogenase [Deltaproteobacteria bacterium RIFCSPHIGHO2_02_FULL_38_15]OGQ34726.1 MAG: N-succinylglutamate 5-semialdehyde dehydrogenase [Deltaproteobacteria bacterium RIFCSPLOWO2_01_FULL_38_9]OGQ59683.1 MAG: N-succinylglutamate 5-semialdehyde dehydrogenase [Deltaproteobacteria bacterium RIFCSPLOWO2_12_FULL_38_8]HBQ20668.1 succinylglutamate-semial